MKLYQLNGIPYEVFPYRGSHAASNFPDQDVIEVVYGYEPDQIKHLQEVRREKLGDIVFNSDNPANSITRVMYAAGFRFSSKFTRKKTTV